MRQFGVRGVTRLFFKGIANLFLFGFGLAAAINDATHKVGVAVNEKMSGAMAGLQLPPGMKLPF